MAKRIGAYVRISRKLLVASAICLAGPGKAPAASVIPPGRAFPWNPGMMSKGGVPNRTAVCATLSPTGADQSSPIQAALDGCPDNGVVMLNPGTFVVNNYVLLRHPVVLRGSGPGTTILKKTNGAQARISQFQPVSPGNYSFDEQPIIIVGPQRWPSEDDSTSQNLTVDGQQGSYSITVANAGAFKAGTFVLLDETSGASWQPVPAGFGCSDNKTPTPCPPKVWQGDRVSWNMHWAEQVYADANQNANASGPYDTTPGVLPASMSWFSRTDRTTNEIKEIASISGNVITFTSPLSLSYRTSHNAQLTAYTLNSIDGASGIQVVNAGVENLTLWGGADGELRFESAAYSWAKNVEVTNWLGEGVAIDDSFRVEIRDSNIHTGSWPEPGGGGYIISLAHGSSEILVENNILIDANKEMVFRSAGAGSVVAYNYADDAWIFTLPAWVEAGLNASHMAGPHHVLFEGNYSQNFDSDYTWGSAGYLTVFRNWLSGKRHSFADDSTYGNVRAVGLEYGSWWDSFIGNILGRSGQMGGWDLTSPSMNCDASGANCSGGVANWTGQDIWKLGYDSLRWEMVPDPNVLSTVIRDGNWDFITNAQHWYNTPGGFTIPASLYLTSKPAFFGNNPWPWVDPSTGATYTLPAKARFDGGGGGGGTTETAGQAGILPNSVSNLSGKVWQQPVNLSQAGTLQSLSIYLAGGTGQVRMGFYKANPSGGCGSDAVLGRAKANPHTLQQGWNTFPVISPRSLAAGTYCIAWTVNNNSVQLASGPVSGGEVWINYPWSSGIPQMLPAPTGSDGNQISTYATFSMP